MKLNRATPMRHAAAMLAIAAIVLALFMTTPTNGDFWWFDASRHAMNGVFLRDFFLEGGLLHPLRFASAYYQQYPAINIGFYPPLLYLTSTPFLAVFGASHAVSQAVVSLYALLAAFMVYLICQQLMDRLAALAAALAFLTMPDVALWARQVQLDVPALALLLCTAWSLLHYLRTGTTRWLLLTAAFTGLAVMMRVQTGFAVPVVALFSLFHRTPQQPPLRFWLGGVLLFIVLASPALAGMLYFSKVAGNLAGAMPNMPRLWTLENWTWYAKALPEQIGWPATWFIIAGLAATAATAVRSGLPLPIRIVGAFAVSSWVFFTIVSNKEPRFNLPSIPFLFMLAAMGFAQVSTLLARAALVLLAAWSIFQLGTKSAVPVANGYREAAALAQTHAPRNDNVLVSAHRDGNFVFNMRR